MAYNNTAILTGNIGSEARLITHGESTFAAFSLATKDSYKNDQEEWVEKETVWHDILVFNPRVIEEVKALKKGSRIRVTGHISYQPFEVQTEHGRTIKKHEASIIAGKVELATLYKKAQTV